MAHDFSVKVGDFGDALLMGGSAAIDAANGDDDNDDFSRPVELGGVAEAPAGTDFGSIGSNCSRDSGLAADTHGSLEYLPPEVLCSARRSARVMQSSVQSSRSIDRSTTQRSIDVDSMYSRAGDVYAFGIIMWELLAWASPYASIPYRSIARR